MARQPAVRIRGQVFTGSRHTFAMDAAIEAIAGKDGRRQRALVRAIDTDREPCELGYAFTDGTSWRDADSVKARKAIALRVV